MASREALGGHLAEREWMTRVLDETHARMDELAEVQRYPFPVDAAAALSATTCRAPNTCAGNAPGCNVLGCASSTTPRRWSFWSTTTAWCPGRRFWTVRRGGRCASRPAAVVLAAGGCAFQSKTLGCDVNTGDGALMAVEAGAVLSGMEFSNAYAIALKGTSLTKTAYYSWATFYRGDRTVLEGAGSARGRSVIAKTLLRRTGVRAHRPGHRRRAARDAQGPAQLLPRLRPARASTRSPTSSKSPWWPREPFAAPVACGSPTTTAPPTCRDCMPPVTRRPAN